VHPSKFGSHKAQYSTCIVIKDAETYIYLYKARQRPLRMIFFSGSYQNYQNVALNNQLTHCGGRGEFVGGDNESLYV
jgi:hypothetical protein